MSAPQHGVRPISHEGQNYRLLRCGEIIELGDELQADDGSWDLAVRCVGSPAPDPAYTSHRVYRRAVAKLGGAA